MQYTSLINVPHERGDRRGGNIKYCPPPGPSRPDSSPFLASARTDSPRRTTTRVARAATGTRAAAARREPRALPEARPDRRMEAAQRLAAVDIAPACLRQTSSWVVGGEA